MNKYQFTAIGCLAYTILFCFNVDFIVAMHAGIEFLLPAMVIAAGFLALIAAIVTRVSNSSGKNRIFYIPAMIIAAGAITLIVGQNSLWL